MIQLISNVINDLEDFIGNDDNNINQLGNNLVNNMKELQSSFNQIDYKVAKRSLEKNTNEFHKEKMEQFQQISSIYDQQIDQIVKNVD